MITVITLPIHVSGALCLKIISLVSLSLSGCHSIRIEVGSTEKSVGIACLSLSIR